MINCLASHFLVVGWGGVDVLEPSILFYNMFCFLKIQFLGLISILVMTFLVGNTLTR